MQEKSSQRASAVPKLHNFDLLVLQKKTEYWAAYWRSNLSHDLPSISLDSATIMSNLSVAQPCCFNMILSSDLSAFHPLGCSFWRTRPKSSDLLTHHQQACSTRVLFLTFVGPIIGSKSSLTDQQTENLFAAKGDQPFTSANWTDISPKPNMCKKARGGLEGGSPQK
jgi:hypothetical protein